MAYLPNAILGTAVCLAASLLIAGCGSDPSPPSPPSAQDAVYSIPVNSPLDSTLDVTQIDFSTADFRIDVPPAHGSIVVNQTTGSFSYLPDENFVGSDDFLWDCADAFGGSNVAQVTIDIIPFGVAKTESGHSPSMIICHR